MDCAPTSWACGFREEDGSPLAIIEAFELRPRLVIVTADRFFQGGLSDFAPTVMKPEAVRTG
jgi:hypothetical protein